MSCGCTKFGPIELYRDEVSTRIKETTELTQEFETIARHNGGEHKLLKCSMCDQYWQISRAWNWGNDEYLFKVPRIQSDEWLKEPYVQPDELLIYNSMMQDYIQKNNFVEKETECQADGCRNRAVRFSIFCVEDHIKSLQNAGVLPKTVQGRWFAPYSAH